MIQAQFHFNSFGSALLHMPVLSTGFSNCISTQAKFKGREKQRVGSSSKGVRKDFLRVPPEKSLLSSYWLKFYYKSSFRPVTGKGCRITFIPFTPIFGTETYGLCRGRVDT